MAIELTSDQARTIARIRTRWPQADVRVHQRPWGVIVEVRQGGHVLSLTGFDGRGRVLADRPLTRAA
jgi:hypothetical protein